MTESPRSSPNGANLFLALFLFYLFLLFFDKICIFRFGIVVNKVNRIVIIFLCHCSKNSFLNVYFLTCNKIITWHIVDFSS